MSEKYLADNDSSTLVVLQEQNGRRLDLLLADAVPAMTRSKAQRAIRLGLVAVDGVTVSKTGMAMREGMEVEFTPPPEVPSNALAEPVDFGLVYQDADLVVVDKPAGLVVHPAAGHEHGTLVNGLLHRFPDIQQAGIRPGIVHRLDRGTSGLMVVGRSERGRDGLTAQFLARSVFKGYLTIVLGRPGSDWGVIDNPIDRNPKDRKRFTSRLGSGREARTLFSVLDYGRGYSLLAIRILTGRTHQIRVHLADAGWPVAGDTLYGPEEGRWPAGIAEAATAGPLLHSAHLAIRHPVSGAEMAFDCKPGQRFDSVLSRYFSPGTSLEPDWSQAGLFPEA